ncbi:MAG TPA: Hpt domain-containing protein [Bacteroidia bacterium]|nr:Hpt domain-containing protein [Bacteroidia bacterium]
MSDENKTQTDLGFLGTFTGNDTARMRKYITLFLGAAPAEAEAIRSALTTADHEKVRASAHSLRPQMTYMGAKAGEELLKRMEEDVKAGKYDELQVTGAKFEAVFSKVCEELQAYLKQIS